MRNKVGIGVLFQGLGKTIKKFYEWCENNDEMCDYDLEHILIDISLPTTNNLDRYFHFHKGNIVDFIEENGFYFNIKRININEGYLEIYNDKGTELLRYHFMEGRKQAEEKAIKECLLLIEEKI